jgi:tetratricopeptide (TPR) repeat protein
VALYSGDRFLGSGFFAAPGQVLTCAHVAAECGGLITVRWEGRCLTERPDRPRRLIPPQRGTGPTYASPDLALISVDPLPDQPYAWFADQAPAIASTVACFGYSDRTTQHGVAPDSVVLQVGGPSGVGLVKVQQGEIPAGMSGSLALDLDSQRVCGMVKASLDPGAPRGGWIIPVQAIAGSLGDTIEQNMAGHGPTSPWRQAATRHGEFARRLFGSRSPLRVASPPDNAPPSWWLDPRHRTTRFQERPELENLLAWAASDDPSTPVVKLITGEGGSGKTRLAVELAARLAALGWIAGILTADDVERLPLIAQALPEIFGYRHRVFIAIDYPEGLGRELSRFLGQIPLPGEGTIRVLLLARFGGAWWNSIHPSTEIRHLIDRTPIELPPLGTDPAAAESRFSEAVQDYRLRILGPGTGPGWGTGVPAGLAEAARRYATAVKLHALALASVLHERDHGVLPGGEVLWTDPLAMLVSHERKHWREAALGRLSADCGQPLDDRILLTPTLVPAYREQDGAAAISRLPGLASRFPGESDDIATLLRNLYPPEGASSLRWWSALPLDRLGETLLAEVLTDPSDGQSADDYVTALLGSVDLPQAVQGLTMMARLNADPEASGIPAARISRCLDTLIAANQSRLLPALLVADRQVAPGLRTSERHLASLDLIDTLTLVQSLLRLPSHSLLQEAGLVLLDHADRILDSDEMRASALPEELRGIVPEMRELGIDLPTQTLAHVHAGALRAQLLLRLGHAGEAIGPAASAARAMRAIFRATSGQDSASRLAVDDQQLVIATGPSDQTESLLHILDVYAQALRAVDRLQESAEVRRECAAVAGRLAESADEAARRTAALAFYKLADILLQLNQAEQAEQWARDAVRLTHASPDSPLAAEALTLWARTLGQAGEHADAAAIAAEALRLHRQAADRTGSGARLAVARQELRHLAPQEAGEPDPLAELRQEAIRDPVSATPVLIGAAIRRAQELAAQGRLEEARLAAAEAIAEARRLAADDPGTHLEFLATTLAQTALLDAVPDPAAAVAEAVGIMRRLLDQHDRSILRMGLAVSLQQYSLLLRSAGQEAAALDGFAEAITLLRPLLAHDRWRTAVHLSANLEMFSQTALAHGDPERAVAAAREAIDLEVSRTDDSTPAPAERLPQLRRLLFLALPRLMGRQAKQGAGPAVMIATGTEACALARSFPAGTMDARDITLFAGTLTIIGTLLCDTGRFEEALRPLGEAIEVLRDHAAADAAGQNTDLLLRTGIAYVSAYRRLERHAEAVHAMTEVLADCRRPLQGGDRERLSCLSLASDLADSLPRPAFTAEALQLTVEMSRTFRELPSDPADRNGGVAASALLVRSSLNEAVGNDISGDGRTSAALEIGADAQFLTERAPMLLTARHAEALTFAAGILSQAGDFGHALDLNTLAIELQQNLAVGRDNGQRQTVGSLVLQGLILSGQHRYEDAVQPLEQALPILLAAGQGISVDEARFLQTTVDVLGTAYRALGQDAAAQAMIDRVRASGVPSVVQEHRAAREPDGDLVAALQAAVNGVDTDPGRSVAALQEVLDAAAGRGDYLIARAASHFMTRALRRTGRIPDALRAADMTVAYGHRANFGPWTRLSDKARRLQIRAEAGHDDHSILSEAIDLIAEADALPQEPVGERGIDPPWIRESLLRSAAAAALRLRQWPEALRFVQAEVLSLRNRGASPAEVADAEFTAFSALTETGRILEAAGLLDRCEPVFLQARSLRHLGIAKQGRAYLATRTGDLAAACRLQAEALDWLYRSADIPQIQGAHSNFSRWLAKADQLPARALAHELAAAVLAELLGQAADIGTITGRMHRTAGEYPATLAALCAAVDEIPGVHFGELLGRLTEGTPATPGEVLSRLLHQARDSQRAIFDEWARHRTEWDPVFAGIVATKQGNIAAARAVTQRLSIYAADQSWSQFSRALGHVLHRRPEAAALPLDIIDQILLRRCTDALDGSVHIPPELALAMPIAGELSRVLGAAQNNEPSSALSRTLEQIAEHEQWRQLLNPLRRILAGDRDPGITAGLTPANTVIISTLLGHLTAI